MMMKRNTFLAGCALFFGMALGLNEAQAQAAFYNGSANVTVGDDALVYVNGMTRNGGIVNVQKKGSVTLDGNLTLNDGSVLKLVSGARGETGSLIGYNTTTTASGTGKIVAERYLTGTGKGDDKWHYFTAPVIGQAIDDAWVSANKIGHVMATNNNVGIDFWRWDEPDGAWYQRLSVNEHFDHTTFNSGAGYIGAVQKATDDANFSFAGNNFNGPVKGGQYSQAVTHTAAQYTPPTQCFNGWNLIGNPYPSAYKVKGAFMEDAEITNKLESYNQALYLYVQGTSATGNTFNGVTFNKVGDYRMISKSGFSNDGFTYYDENGGQLETGTFGPIEQDYIAPGQAFFVRVKAGVNALNFPANYREHAFGAQTLFHKKAATVEESWPGFMLLANNEKHHASVAVVSFDDKMTAGLDPGCDVAKLEVRSNQQTILIYTQMVEGDATVKMAEQSLPMEVKDDFGSDLAAYEIPVGVELTATSIVDFMTMQKHMDDQKIILEDRKLGVFTDINGGKYSTTFEKSENGLGRFFLHVGKKAETIDTPAYDKLQITTYMEDRNHLIVLNPANVIGDYIIYDMNGSIVGNGHLNGDDKQSIDVDLAFGMYVLKVNTSLKTQSFKFINK